MEEKKSPRLNREWTGQIRKELQPGIRKIRFPVYMTDHLMNADIDELELSVRSSNCLHRARYQKIGQLVQRITRSDDLKRIRNCGRKSICEIMSSLLAYQYSELPSSSQQQFLRRIIELSQLSEEAAVTYMEEGDFS